MSGPDFEAVLAPHLPGDYTHLFHDDPGAIDPPVACRCGWRREHRVSHAAHLSAALHAELAHWLDAEETWDRAWEAIAKVRDACPRTVDDADSGDVTTAALAALTTTDQEDHR